MNDGRHDRLPDDLEPVAAWIRAEQPEISGLDLDRIKRRAMAQATQGPTETTRLPAWLAGVPSLWKGAHMGLRPRPLLTLLLLGAIIGVLPITALAATGNIPEGLTDAVGIGSEDESEDGDSEDDPQRDAAETQYGGDDDEGDGGDGGGNPGGGNGKGKGNPGGGNGKDRDDDDEGGGPPPGILPEPTPDQAMQLALAECRIFQQNFGSDFGQCVATSASGLRDDPATPQNERTSPPLAICQAAGFSRPRARGHRRGDLGACELALTRTRARFLVGLF